MYIFCFIQNKMLTCTTIQYVSNCNDSDDEGGRRDHRDINVMFSWGQNLLKIHDGIAMMIQTWVGKNAMLSKGQILLEIPNAFDGPNLGGKKCDVFMRANSKLRMPLLWWPKLGWKKMWCFHEVVLWTYRYSLMFIIKQGEKHISFDEFITLMKFLK